ncbi:MAG: hypothetical protein GX260_05245 [Tissierellia bacterium]|nr:hypothetical protein [Bacillota bacterium]NLL23169.1 hypothetical protein [Tissierellia bacterium]
MSVYDFLIGGEENHTFRTYNDKYENLDDQAIKGIGIAGSKTIFVSITELDENDAKICFSEPVEK